jgi:hypothetical protein
MRAHNFIGAVMTIRTQEEELEIVRAFDDPEYKLGYKNIANERLILEACQGKPANTHTVRDAFQSIKHKLALNSNYVEAYQELWANYPDYRLDGNIRILDSLASVHQAITYDILKELIENPNVHQQLSLTPRAAQANADEAERLQIIEKILRGQNIYEWRRLSDGKIMNGGRAELEQDTLETLRYINDFVQNQRELYATDTKTLREEQRKKELHEAQIRARMIQEKAAFAPVPDFYESPTRPGVKQAWSENLLRRLPNSEIERVFNLYGEQALTIACRKNQLL